MTPRETRTIKELLQLMLDNQNQFEYGLCRWTGNLIHMRLIGSDERNILIDYINKNRPNMFSSINAFTRKIDKNPYYWDISDITPRIKWLNKHIRKNK